jgi:hypothetical protein
MIEYTYKNNDFQLSKHLLILYVFRSVSFKLLERYPRKSGSISLQCVRCVRCVRIYRSSIMISIHTIFNNKSQFIEEGESVSENDIAKVDAELIRELEEIYIDEEEENLI